MGGCLVFCFDVSCGFLCGSFYGSFPEAQGSVGFFGILEALLS